MIFEIGTIWKYNAGVDRSVYKVIEDDPENGRVMMEVSGNGSAGVTFCGYDFIKKFLVMAE